MITYTIYSSKNHSSLATVSIDIKHTFVHGPQLNLEGKQGINIQQVFVGNVPVLGSHREM